MRFEDVQHQDRALAIIRRGLASGRTPHAYLFEGPEGVGKEKTALALAARLLCLNADLAADADACGACDSCRMLAAGNHPDFHLVERKLNKVHPDRNVRASLGLFMVVDLIRHFVIEPATLKPTLSPRRVFVIRDAERMNEDAQNALLKTLEEPPGTACLILVTASAGRMLPTIRSRCQQVRFTRLPEEFVRGELVSQAGVGTAEARALAALSEGQLGRALRWQRLELLARLETVAGLLDLLPGGDAEVFDQAANRVVEEVALAELALNAEEAAVAAEEETKRRGGGSKTVPTDAARDAAKVVLALLAALYRDAQLRRAGAGALARLAAQARRTEGLAATQSEDQLAAALAALAAAEQMLDRNVNVRLVFDRLLVALRGEVGAA